MFQAWLLFGCSSLLVYVCWMVRDTSKRWERIVEPLVFELSSTNNLPPDHPDGGRAETLPN